MPLIKSGSDAAKSENIRREMHAGKPRDQAVAIALDTARKYRSTGGEGGKRKKRVKPAGRA